MDNQASLDLAEEMVTTARVTTETHRPGFYHIFDSFASHLEQTSKYIDNDKFRRFFFEIWTINRTLAMQLNYHLRAKLQERIRRAESSSEVEGINELMINAAEEVSISVLSSSDGTSRIDMERLIDGIGLSSEDIGGEAYTRVYLNIAHTLRSIYDSFVDNWSEFVIGIYERLEEAIESGWEEVFTVTNQVRLETDNEAMMLRRGLHA